jgi:hypothetical protein
MNDRDLDNKKDDGKREATPADKPKRPSLQDFSRSIFLDAVQKPRIVTCPQGVVAYSISPNPRGSEILTRLFDPESIDQKIRDILAANPKAEFTPELQRALGITVMDFQRAPNQPSLNTSEDVLF